MSVDIGQPAPDFTLPKAGGGTVSLAELRGRTVVLYFYPKADTPGCTKEACGFSEQLPDFGDGVTVIGVSKDAVPALEKFRDKYGLGIILASDKDGAVIERYGTWVQKSMYGRSYMGIDRATFLIDGAGVVRGIWRKVKIPGHVKEVLAAAKAA